MKSDELICSFFPGFQMLYYLQSYLIGQIVENVIVVVAILIRILTYRMGQEYLQSQFAPHSIAYHINRDAHTGRAVCVHLRWSIFISAILALFNGNNTNVLLVGHRFRNKKKPKI